MRWIEKGLPEVKTSGKSVTRQISEVFTLDNLLEKIKHSPLSPSDASRIVAVLKDKGWNYSQIIFQIV